eukprot:724941-Prorocentrum_minimum.AAC.1
MMQLQPMDDDTITNDDTLTNDDTITNDNTITNSRLFVALKSNCFFGGRFGGLPVELFGCSTSTTPTANNTNITSPQPPPPSPSGTNLAIVGGGVAAGVALLMLLAGGAWCWFYRWRISTSDNTDHATRNPTFGMSTRTPASPRTPPKDKPTSNHDDIAVNMYDNPLGSEWEQDETERSVPDLKTEHAVEGGAADAPVMASSAQISEVVEQLSRLAKMKLVAGVSGFVSPWGCEPQQVTIHLGFWWGVLTPQGLDPGAGGGVWTPAGGAGSRARKGAVPQVDDIECKVCHEKTYTSDNCTNPTNPAIILCDGEHSGEDYGYHIQCLAPPLVRRVPEKETGCVRNAPASYHGRCNYRETDANRVYCYVVWQAKISPPGTRDRSGHFTWISRPGK